MPITDKLDKLLEKNQKPKLIWTGFLFFQEYIMENFVEKNPILYNLIKLMDTINEFEYKGIPVIKEPTN